MPKGVVIDETSSSTEFDAWQDRSIWAGPRGVPGSRRADLIRHLVVRHAPVWSRVRHQRLHDPLDAADTDLARDGTDVKLLPCVGRRARPLTATVTANDRNHRLTRAAQTAGHAPYQAPAARPLHLKADSRNDPAAAVQAGRGQQRSIRTDRN